MNKVRTVLVYKNYTTDFLDQLPDKVRDKFIWTFQLIEDIEVIPKTYLKHLEDGIYEIRLKFGSNIYRIMAFFDEDKLVTNCKRISKEDTENTESSNFKSKEN